MYSYILLLTVCLLNLADFLCVEKTEECALVELKSFDEVEETVLNLGPCIDVHINNPRESTEVLAANVLASLSPNIVNLKISGGLGRIEDTTFWSYQSTLKRISFEHNNLPVLNKNTFRNLTLKSLVLKDNNIVHLGNFKSWSYIMLDLSHNKINAILRGTFFDNARTIKLNYNSISFIEPECFPKSLKILQLKYNMLQFIEGHFGNLNKLNELDLRHNVLERVSLANSELDFLDLSFNRIKQLDDNFGNLTNLKMLYLRQNNIKEIYPLTLGRLNNLMLLDISFNYFADFPYKYLSKSVRTIYKSGNPWNCKCLANFERYLFANKIEVRRYCDTEVIGNGTLPICIAFPKNCINMVDENLVSRFFSDISTFYTLGKSCFK